jgi:hypothetical protein
MLAVRFQWIRIEEQRAVERDAGDEPVVERPLQYIDVFRVAVEQKETLVPVVHADRGAGLVVGGHVRQLVCLAEGLVAAGGADAARQIELRADCVGPDGVDRLDVRRVSGERGDIGHS